MKLLSSAEFWLYLLLANLIDICTKYIQNIYFPTLASVLRERSEIWVAIGPIVWAVSAETDGIDKDDRGSRELTSLKVL
ncbi:hypothetical protein PF011_g15082 [Phytophthora fragariae]|uniref:Uncharacterized protein n=1 Tax=Phytophthora fragariae TaxID=53985 RepID=A0A6A3K2Y7_9STRA|nr:hypothetical protein PF011_g15082 [Phytophthora fragariae]